MSFLRKVYGWERYLLIASLLAIGVAAVLTEPLNAQARQPRAPDHDEHVHDHHDHEHDLHIHQWPPMISQSPPPQGAAEPPAASFHRL